MKGPAVQAPIGAKGDHQELTVALRVQARRRHLCPRVNFSIVGQVSRIEPTFAPHTRPQQLFRQFGVLLLQYRQAFLLPGEVVAAGQRVATQRQEYPKNRSAQQDPTN